MKLKDYVAYTPKKISGLFGKIKKYIMG